MGVELPTPAGDEPTMRFPYEEVATLDEAIAWIERPPLPAATLKKLEKGVLLTARCRQRRQGGARSDRTGMDRAAIRRLRGDHEGEVSLLTVWSGECRTTA
jgi:hypothetical protein